MYRFKSWHSTSESITFQSDENGNMVEIEPESAQTISSEQFYSFLDLCFSEATTFSLQKGLWPNSIDTSLEKDLEPHMLQTIYSIKWFGYDLSNAPPGSEWTMCIQIYSASDTTKSILKSYLNDIFLGYASSNMLPNKFTLEDLCFFKGKNIIVGSVSHEFILHVYPSNQTFEQAILPLGRWECLDYPAPTLLP